MKLQFLKLRGGKFAIIPPDEIQQNIVQRRRFGFWPQTKVKQIQIKYHILDGHLIATFHRIDKSVTFFNRQAAEKWFEKKLDVSPLVGNKIITSDAELQMTFSCPHCGTIKSQKRRRFFHVPEKVLDHKAAIPETQIQGATCKCGKNCHLDVHQIGNIHVRVR